MKRFLGALLSLMIMLACLGVQAEEISLYSQFLNNDATFETLEQAHQNGPEQLAALTGRTYMPDPALDAYTPGTTYVYRSAGTYTNLSAAYRMNTNLLVYTDEHFETADDALAYLRNLGVTDIIDQAHGSAVLVTPIDPEAGFGAADQYDYLRLQSAMCNLGYSQTTDEGPCYYADNTYFGGLTYRYAIGIGGGASFLCNYVAPTLDYAGRIAAMLLVNPTMDDALEVSVPMPVYLVNAGETVFDKFQAANEAYATEETSATMASFNQTFPVRRVVVAKDGTSDLTTYVNDAYYSLFTRAMRTPVVKAGLFVAANEFSGYSWNQAPYTLTDRNAVLDGVTADGIHVVEHQEERFSDYKAANGEYVTTWYEFLPEEVLNNTADEHSIPLLLCNHGGGDDPVQAVDELGWLKLAGEERIAIIAQRHTSEIPGSSIFDGSPFDTMSDVLPQMVRYMLETYPALDPSRVYVSGYSMGGSCTNRAVYGDASVFAAAVNMSGTPYTHTEGQDEQFKTLDIPMMLTTCTYDTYTHFDAENGIIAEDFQMNINDYLTYNEMDTVTFDFETYPMSGFKGDVYRETMVNDEYPLYSWFFLNDEGAPMVGLSIIEFIPHGLYQEYANIAWDYMKHFSRDPETLEISYCPY